jgi:hypothetical protein
MSFVSHQAVETEFPRLWQQIRLSSAGPMPRVCFMSRRGNSSARSPAKSIIQMRLLSAGLVLLVGIEGGMSRPPPTRCQKRTIGLAAFNTLSRSFEESWADISAEDVEKAVIWFIGFWEKMVEVLPELKRLSLSQGSRGRRGIGRREKGIGSS